MNRLLSILLLVALLVSVSAVLHKEEEKPAPHKIQYYPAKPQSNDPYRTKTMNDPAEPKASWPEVVGLSGNEAMAKIRSETTGLTILIVPDGSMVTMDYRTDRVRIFVDTDERVVRAPSLG